MTAAIRLRMESLYGAAMRRISDRTAAAARADAPGAPRRARTSASSRRISVARSGSVSSATVSLATASGVNCVLDQLRHDRPAGHKVHHPVGVHAHEARGRSRRSRATTGTRSTIGRPCSAVWIVAVPDAVTTTSAAASTSSVAPSTDRDRHAGAADARERREQGVRRARARARPGTARPAPSRDQHGGIGERRQDLATPRSAGCLAAARRPACPGPSPAAPSTSRRSRAGTARSTSGWPTNSTARRPSRTAAPRTERSPACGRRTA